MCLHRWQRCVGWIFIQRATVKLLIQSHRLSSSSTNLQPLLLDVGVTGDLPLICSSQTDCP